MTLSDSAAMLAASVADGALRDALSLLDRCIAISSEIDEDVVRSAAGLARKTYLFELSNCVINKNTAKALEIVDRLYGESKDMARLCDELLSHFRTLMLIKSVKNPRDIVIMADDEFEQAQTQSDYLSLADIVYYMDVLSKAYQNMGRGTGDRTELEMAVVKLSSAELDGTIEALTARVTALEKAVKKGIKVNYVPEQVQTVPQSVQSETPKPEVQNAEPEKSQETKPVYGKNKGRAGNSDASCLRCRHRNSPFSQYRNNPFLYSKSLRKQLKDRALTLMQSIITHSLFPIGQR